MKQTQKGFTLIELLVVIAIIAVLSVVVILTLNPAELLRQARDSTRISDLNTMKSAISLFLADTSSSTGLLGGASGNYMTCYIGGPSGTATSACTGIFGQDPTAWTVASSVAVSGSGWIPINFNAISSGAPIGTLPLDPTNASPTVYFYRASSTTATFKLAGRLESTKYGTTQDLDNIDGGNDAGAFEVGTDLTM